MVLFWHRSLCVAFIGAAAIGREADQNTLAKIDYLIAFAILDQNTHDALIAIVFWIRSTDYIQQIQLQIWHTKLNQSSLFSFILNSLSWNETLGKCFRAERWLKKFAHLTPAWSDLVWW